MKIEFGPVRRRLGVSLVMAAAAIAVGCTTPEAVAKFCSAAVSTLAAGRPIFTDFKASCLREVNSRNPLASFAVARDDDPACAEIGRQAEAAKAASELLADYFTAVNALASFNTAKVGTSAASLADKASDLAKAGTNTRNALNALGSFLATSATAGYRQRQLTRDLPQSSQSAIAVLDGLAAIVRDDYVGRLLKSEEEKLATRYKEFVSDRQQAAPLSAEVQLALYERWKSDEDAIATRRATAEKFVVGLQSISKGLSALAANADKITAKELIALLQPYASQLETLIPAIQKAL